MVVVGWLGTATVTTQGPQGSHDTTKSGDFLATTGDHYLATSGDFFMATDRPIPGGRVRALAVLTTDVRYGVPAGR